MKITSICGIIISILVGVVIISSHNIGIGIVIMPVGAFASWISAFTLYGLGKLIETNENKMHMIKDIGTMIEELANDVYATSLSQSDEKQDGCSDHLARASKATVSAVENLSHMIGKSKMKK